MTTFTLHSEYLHFIEIRQETSGMKHSEL